MDDTGFDHQARLFHVEEAAEVLAIGRTKAYELIAMGQLHAIHVGRATRISGHELSRFVRSLDRPEPSTDTKPRRRLTAEPTLFDPEPPGAE